MFVRRGMKKPLTNRFVSGYLYLTLMYRLTPGVRRTVQPAGALPPWNLLVTDWLVIPTMAATSAAVSGAKSGAADQLPVLG